MAKYQAAIDVWADGVSEALRNGNLKLQRGQWLRLGKDNPKLSRFHHANKYSICAFHYPRATKEFVQFTRDLNELNKGKKHD